MRTPSISFKGLQKPGSYAAVQIVTILATITAVSLVIFKEYFASQFGGRATPQLIQWIGIGAGSAAVTALILTHLFWKRAASAEPKKNEPTPSQPEFTPAKDDKPPYLIHARYGTPSELVRPTLPIEYKDAPAITTLLAHLDENFVMIQTDPDVSHAVAFLSSLYIKLLKSPENGRLEIKKWIRLFPSPMNTHQKAIKQTLQRLLVSPFRATFMEIVKDTETLKSLNLYLNKTDALSDLRAFGIKAPVSRPPILVINSALLMNPNLPHEHLDPTTELVCFYGEKKSAALIPKVWMEDILTQEIPEASSKFIEVTGKELAQEESAHSPLLAIEPPSTNERAAHTLLAIEAPPTVKVEAPSPVVDYLKTRRNQELNRFPLSRIPEADEEWEVPAAVPFTEAAVQEKPKTLSLSLDYASPLELAQKWYSNEEMLVVGEQMRYLAHHFEMVEVDSKEKALAISLMHFYQTNPDEAKKLLLPELVELLEKNERKVLESMKLELKIPFKYIKSTAFAYKSAIPHALQVSPLRGMEKEGKEMSSFLPESGSFLVIFERTKESYSVLIPKKQAN